MKSPQRSHRIGTRRRRRENGSRRFLRVESLETRCLLTAVPVTLQITELYPFFTPDADDPAGFDSGDYYAKVTIGNRPEQDSRFFVDPITSGHLIYPPFWEFTDFIDPADFNLGLIPVQIKVFDSDAVFDDVMDITTQAGTTLTFTFDVNGGTLQGQSFGNGDGDADARLRFEMFKSTPVTVTLESFEQLDDPDPEPGDGEYKFAVKIGTMTEITSAEYGGPNVDLAGLRFTRYVNPAQPLIDIRIRAYDVDLSFDDTMDISPASGETALTLRYDLYRGTWVEQNGLFSSPTGEAQGDGDDDRGKIKFNIVASDSDGDGLLDLWETHGIDANLDGQIDLLLNTDPRHKDLFVEVDAMQGFVPQVAALNDVTAAFAAAPNSLVKNPDGEDGITLHILLDEKNIPNAKWATGFPEFDLIKHNTNPSIAGGFGTVADRASPNAANILAAKRLVYRYSIFADEYGTSGSSGQAEVVEFDPPTQLDDVRGGNDFFVTLGPWGGGNRDQQSGTFMHELGHTLGLLHSGHQLSTGNDRQFNNKPNYHSVMNYIWQLKYLLGTAPTAQELAFANSWTLDYSRKEFNDLNEAHLNETTGIGGHPGHIVRLDNGMFVPESGPVDWNGDGDANDTDVPVEINGFGLKDVLEGSEDWSRIRYSFRDSANFADGVHGPTDHDHMTFADFQNQNEALVYAPDTGDGPDKLTLRRNGANLEVFDNLAGVVVASRAIDQTRLVQIIGIHGENDTLIIDYNFGGFFAPASGIEFLGGDGANDSLRIIGTGATTGSYNPDAATPGNGTSTVTAGGVSATIAFTGLEPLEVAGMASYSFVSPNSVDVLSLNAGLGSGGQTAYVLSGTSDGVAFESLTFFNIGTFTLDAASNDGAAPNDSVTVGPTGSAAVTTMLIRTGAGNDVVSVTPSAGAAIDVDTGLDSDNLNFRGQQLIFSLTATNLTAATRATLSYSGAETLGLYDGVFQVPASSTITTTVDVNNGGVLAGLGTVSGAITVNPGGTIGPGNNGPGTLRVSNTQFTAGSNFSVDLNGLTSGLSSDQLRVTGTVDLASANLVGSVGTSLIVPGDEYVIIRKDGAPVVGQFGNQAAGGIVTIGGKQFAVDYAFDGDGDGQFNDVALIAYGAALAPDPCDPRRTALFVSATSGNDIIRFVPVAGSDKVQVFINGQSQGQFRPSGLLIAFGQAGNDTITVELPSRKSWLYGQNGDDVLRSGNGNSLLNGGIGNDTLTSGNGKDILIGGLGADVLKSGSGEDILIAGATVYDTNTAANRMAWCRIVDEWSRGTKGYQTRIKNLQLGGGRNGSVLLNSSKVLDDASVDQVFGDNGSDWFLFNSVGGTALDQSDRKSGEILTDL